MSNVFWLTLWAVSLFLFLTVPILVSADRRNRWMERLRTCQWHVELPSDSEAVEGEQGGGDGGNDDEEFHYVISQAQEDEIRQAYLTSKLEPYTKALAVAEINSCCTFCPPAETSAPTLAKDVAQASSLTIDNVGTSSETEPSVASDIVSVEGGGGAGEEEKEEEEEEKDGGDSADDGGLLANYYNMEEYINDVGGLITVPLAGVCATAASDEEAPPVEREAPNGCAICLSPYEADEKVTWSSNPQCLHVFHTDCILDWLMTSGKKTLRNQRRHEQQQQRYNDDPIQKITNFPMLCPCCRQEFILKDELGSDDVAADKPEDEEENNSDTSNDPSTTQAPNEPPRDSTEQIEHV